MAGKATIIIQGTAWGVRETQNGKRYLSVSVSPGYRDRNGNWKSQPEHYYSVWPAGYANLNPVFDQIAQLRQNQDQFVDVTIVGEVSGCDAYTNKNGGLAASCSVSASARRHHEREAEGRRTVAGLRRSGRLHAAAAGRIPAVAATGLRPVGQRRQRPGVLTCCICITMRRRRTWNLSALLTDAPCIRQGRSHARSARRKPTK